MPGPNQIYCKTPRWRTKATEVPVLLILLSLDVFNFKYCFMFGVSIFFQNLIKIFNLTLQIAIKSYKIDKLLPWIKKDIFDHRDQEQLVPNINSLKIILWLFFKLDLNIKDNFEKRLLKIKYVCICKLLKITLCIDGDGYTEVYQKPSDLIYASVSCFINTNSFYLSVNFYSSVFLWIFAWRVFYFNGEKLKRLMFEWRLFLHLMLDAGFQLKGPST